MSKKWNIIDQNHTQTNRYSNQLYVLDFVVGAAKRLQRRPDWITVSEQVRELLKSQTFNCFLDYWQYFEGNSVLYLKAVEWVQNWYNMFKISC